MIKSTKNPSVIHSDNKVQILAENVLSIQVCAAGEMSGRDVEMWLARWHPAGTTVGWRVAPEEKMTDPNPVTCADNLTRKHWVLWC